MKVPVIQMTMSEPDACDNVKYADCRPLPASYMSEYSVLGLMVDKLVRAVEILEVNGFDIDIEAFGAEMEILGPAQLPVVVEILAESGVCCSIGDVIDSVYQG